MDIDQFDSQPAAKVSKKEIEVELPSDENDARRANEPSVVAKPPPISEQDLTSGWDTIKDGANLNQTVVVPEFNSSELPMTQGEDGEQV